MNALCQLCGCEIDDMMDACPGCLAGRQDSVDGPSRRNHQYDGSGKLEIVPISLEEANVFVSEHHRHHDPVTGHKFSVAVAEGGKVRGVAIVGRPVSRMLDNGWTLEVNRCCTDGVFNGCSMLYRTCWRAASAMGYRRLITYTLPEEGGGSLKGAGFMLVGERGGGSWNRKERPRVDTHPMQTKWLWEMNA